MNIIKYIRIKCIFVLAHIKYIAKNYLFIHPSKVTKPEPSEILTAELCEHRNNPQPPRCNILFL